MADVAKTIGDLGAAVHDAATLLAQVKALKEGQTEFARALAKLDDRLRAAEQNVAALSARLDVIDRDLRDLIDGKISAAQAEMRAAATTIASNVVAQFLGTFNTNMMTLTRDITNLQHQQNLNGQMSEFLAQPRRSPETLAGPEANGA